MNKIVAPMSFTRLLLTMLAGYCFTAAAMAQPAFQKVFNPDTIGPGSISTLTFTIDNGSGIPVTDIAFTDVLPAGMTIASPPAIFTGCVNMLVTAPAGAGTISTTGGRLSAFASCTVSVNVTSSVIGVLMNTSGDLTSSAGNSGTASDDLMVEADRPGFSKSFSPSTVNFGDRSTLTFTIDNTLNPSQVFSLQFVDEFPVGMRVGDPANASTTCMGGTITALPGADNIAYGPAFPGDASLPAGANCTLSVDVDTSAVGTLGNTTGELSSVSPVFPESSGMAGAELEVMLDSELLLQKSFDGDPLPPGSSLNLTFELTNLDRNFTATNISFTDDLDATLTGLIATGLPLNDVCGAGSQLTGTSVLTLTGGSLTPEGSCQFSVAIQIPAAAAPGAYPNVTSSVSGDLGGSSVVGNPASDTLFVSEAPLLSKTFLTNPVGAGQPFSMEFTITNVSATSAATDISFEDNLSAFLSGVSIQALPAAGFCGAGSVAFTFAFFGDTILQIIGGNLAAGDSCTFTIDLISSPGTPVGDYVNTTGAISATVNAVNTVGLNASDTLTLIAAPRFSKSFTDDPVLPGDTVTLEFTIEHDEAAPADATDISFSDDLDAVLAGLSAVGLPSNDVCGAGSQISGTTNLVLTGGTLAPGSSCTFSVTLQVPAGALPGIFNNVTSDLSALVSGVTSTGSPAEDNLMIAGLSFNKEFIDDPVLPGGTVTLRFTIDNTSPINDASGIFFTDSLSTTLPGLTAIMLPLTDICGAGSSISGTTFLIMVGGNLPPGDSCSFDVTLQVPAGAPDGSFSNTTSALVATVGGSTVTLPPAADTLVVNSNILSFSKTFTDDPVMPGSMVTLEFTLNNQSATETITDITFTDDLGAVLSGLTATGLPTANICGAGSQLSGVSLLTLTGASLVPGASCTFSVTLQVPVAAPFGDFTNTTSEVTGTASGVAITGDPASDVLQIQLVNFSKAFVNPLTTGTTTTLSFTIENNGNTLLDSISFSDDLDAVTPGLTATGLPMNDVCGAGSQISGTSLLTLTGGSLAAGASCTIVVNVMAPAGGMPGVFTNTTSDLLVGGLALANPAIDDLILVGIPELTITPSTTDFGDVLVGTSSTGMDVLLENTGNDNLDITSIDAALAPFALTGGSCIAAPFTLAAATSCTLSYSFSPAATGAAMQTLSVSSNAPGSPGSFSLQGNGVQPAISVAPNLLDFGDQEVNTTSAAMSSTISNTGSADLTVMSITAATAPFMLSGGSCAAAPFVLMPGATCTVDFTFAPTATGSTMQDLTIISDAPTTPDTLSLQGNGTQAGLGLSAAMLDFGNVNLNNTATLPLMLTNTGDADLSISAISDPLMPFVVDNGTCGALPIILMPAQQCQLDVSFTPTVTGPAMATMDFTSNAPTSPDTVSLNGSGVQPQLVLDLNDIDFGIITVGVTESVPVVLMNTGDGDLTVNQLTDPMSPFAVLTGTCGSTPFVLTPAAQCQLEVTFRPIGSREFISAFDVVSDAADSPATVNLRGTGLLVEVPTLNQWMLLLLAVLLLTMALRSAKIRIHE